MNLNLKGFNQLVEDMGAALPKLRLHANRRLRRLGGAGYIRGERVCGSLAAVAGRPCVAVYACIDIRRSRSGYLDGRFFVGKAAGGTGYWDSDLLAFCF